MTPRASRWLLVGVASVYLVAVAAWAGGLVVLGAIVAPTVFGVVPAPTSADARTERRRSTGGLGAATGSTPRSGGNSSCSPSVGVTKASISAPYDRCSGSTVTRHVVDPFHDGVVRDAAQLRELVRRVLGPDAELQPGHFDAVSDRDVLLRLENNLKIRLIQEGDLEKAAAAL